MAFELPEPLQRFSRLQNYDRGEMLFRRGDPARCVFFVQSGEVRMLRSGRAGEDILLHRARPGEFFAEAALECPRYLCDGIAFQASTLAVIPKNHLASLIDNDRGLFEAVEFTDYARASGGASKDRTTRAFKRRRTRSALYG